MLIVVAATLEVALVVEVQVLAVEVVLLVAEVASVAVEVALDATREASLVALGVALAVAANDLDTEAISLFDEGFGS